MSNRLNELFASMEQHDESTKFDMVISNEGYQLANRLGLEDNDDKSIDTEYMSLFSKEVEDEDDNEYCHYRLFMGPILEDTPSTRRILNTLLNAGEKDRLELRINSGGGSIAIGMRFISLMTNQFKGRVTAFIDASAGSMASSTFVMADTRIIYPHSEIMFHNYSSMLLGKGDELMTQAQHQDSLYADMLKTHLLDNGFLTEDELTRLRDGKDFWFGCDEMCRRGIATHVMVSNHCIPAKEYIERKSNGGLKPEQVLAEHLEATHGVDGDEMYNSLVKRIVDDFSN